MKEKILQLQDLLNEIYECIDSHIVLENFNLEELDTMYNDMDAPDEDVEKIKAAFKASIIAHKNDEEFYTKEIEQLKILLVNAAGKLSKIQEENLIGKPNKEILALLHSGLLTTKSTIVGGMNNNEKKCYFTKDGFLAIESRNKTVKFGSLRKAAIEIWGKDIPSQWWFWNVLTEDGRKVPLEEFRRKM